MKQIFKMIALFAALILTSTVYIVGMLNDVRCQIDSTESDIKLLSSELECYKNELSNINYDEDIAAIYNEINGVNEAVQNLSNEVQDLNDTVQHEAQSAQKQSDNVHSEAESSTNKKQDKQEKSDDKSESENTSNPNNGQSNGIYEDMADSYYGRLYIPDLGISVALYYGYQQYITDRADSANIFSFEDFKGYTIADHNNQEFSKLFKVKVGTKGYIEHKTYGRINIVCTDVLSGYNNGKYIVDENGENTMNLTDYMMYTCKSGKNSVLICLWDRS